MNEEVLKLANDLTRHLNIKKEQLRHITTREICKVDFNGYDLTIKGECASIVKRVIVAHLESSIFKAQKELDKL
jgi:hypothetical protein